MAGSGSIALPHASVLTAQPRATTEPALIRWTLIGTALAFLGVFLCVPLVAARAGDAARSRHGNGPLTAQPMHDPTAITDVEEHMNAVDFIKQEHQNAKELFQEIEQASPEERGELWEDLKPELQVHEHVENEFLYGPLSNEAKAKGTPLADFQDRQDKDVGELERAMGELERQDAASDTWLTQLKKIRDALAKHIAVEERDILPMIPNVWSASKLEEAGKRMEEGKDRKVREALTR